MTIMVVILLTMLFMLGALVFTTGSSMVLDNGSYYLGITIPRNYRNEEAVKAIAAEYKKSWRVISLIGLATCFMILFFYDYVSIQMVYIMVWFFALIYVYQQNLKKYGWKLYNWKITQEWYNSEESTGKLRRIDTAVTVNKDRMPVSCVLCIQIYHSGLFGSFIQLCHVCSGVSCDVFCDSQVAHQGLL